MIKSNGAVVKQAMSEVSMSVEGNSASASSIICLTCIVDSSAEPTEMTDGSSSAIARSSASQVERGYASGFEHFH